MTFMLHDRVSVLLDGLGRGSIQPIAYTTAFVARLRRPGGSPAYPEAAEWLRRHQWPDGSWGGAIEQPADRLVSTLAALVALADSRCGAVGRAVEYLWHRRGEWRGSPYQTIAFELAVPHLLAEARAAGLALPYEDFADLDRERADKLARIPPGAPADRATTLLYSVEVLGDVLPPAAAARFVAGNGSLGNSPSATAAYWAATGDPAALGYLNRLARAGFDGGYPEVWPALTFETAWVVYLLQRARLLPPAAAAHLKELRNLLGETGAVAIDPTFPVPDSDDSAMVFNALLGAGHDVAHLLPGLLAFEGERSFTTFPFERGASISANARVLEALGHDPERFAGQLAKIVAYLLGERRDGGWWQDKWHASPYYATAQVAFALSRHAPDALAGTAEWLRRTQHPDGSWGEQGGTAEESAYAVLALDALADRFPAPPRVFAAAGDYLRGHADDQAYPELWVGKGLYTPYAVVKGAVLAACAVAAHHAGPS